MAISKPCPRCQQPIDIPEPIPDKITCAKCGAVIKYKMQPALTTTEAAKATPTVAAGKPASVEKSKTPASTGGIVSFLHSFIPKPILFGFYGAMGGLLGVLFLGELFWLILHPTPVVVAPLIVAVSPELTLYPGSKNKVTVKIERHGFDGPVKLEALDLPEDVAIPEVTIAAGQKEAELDVATGDFIADGKHTAKVRATAPGQEKKIEATEPIQLIIRQTPASVGISVPPIVTVYGAGRNDFEFLIDRKRFEGQVRIEVLDLPRGVHIPMVELPAKATKGRIQVSADKDAKLGAEILPVEVRTLANHKIATKAEFQLNVLPPPGKLQLAASPQVTVYPGTKNKIVVKIARQEFAGRIQVDVTGGPRGVQFSSAIIEPDQTGAEIEVTASQDMQTGAPPEKNLRVRAKAMIAEDISTSVPLQLNIEPPPPSVQLAVSPRVPVFPGGKASFGVKISRTRFQGPVRLDAQGVNPGFLKIPSLIIPADKTEGEMEVTVSLAALSLPLKQIMPVQVVAHSMAKGPQAPPTSEKVEVEILPPPSDLQLTVSPTVEVYQAGKCKFTVKVARTGFVGPVQLKFNNLPPGVTLDPGPIFANDLVLNGKATIDVAPKTYAIELTATGPKAPDGKVPTTTKKFDLKVKPFDPSIRPPLDIVFVLDVTQSLDPQIAALRDGIGQFVQGLKDKELEARIGLVGFRDIIYDDVPLEKLKFKGELFTTDLKAFSAEVGKLKAKGGGDDPESSLDGIVEATKYPFRPKAMKVLLLITDEKPQTKGNSVTMKIAQQALRDKKIDQLHLIIKKADEPIYAPLQQVAKGGKFDFHEASKNKQGFASILPLLSKEIATTIGAPEPVATVPGQPESAAPPTAPPGEKRPEPRAEATPSSPQPVTPAPPKAGEASIIRSADPRPPVAEDVNPPKAELPSLQGLQSTAMYADKDRPWLLIAVALWTAALAAGIALLLAGAQKRYLNQAWLTIGEIAKALLLGAAAGLFAGLVVQWLFNLSSLGAPWWVATSRVVAWVVLGGLIGGAMSYFVPNMQRNRAIVGGCLGGLIGALGFVLVKFLADMFLERYIGEGLVNFLGRLIGAALLGLFIGFMVALAEIASRRYWLEVAFGEREVRTVTLGTATVALGGDEKLAGVYVPYAAPRAIGFRVDKNRVFCEDFVTGKTIEATPGEQRTVAGAKVRVCSAASATPTGASLQLIVVRDMALMIGMPLTGDDIPGLEAQGSDGVVALVSRRPNNPKIFLLRNRSKQTWIVTEPDGKQRKVEPGLGIELSSRCEIDFGQVKATLDPAQDSPAGAALAK